VVRSGQGTSSNIITRSVIDFFTASIIPCLALRGIARGIARSSTLRAKVLLLNAENDRETDGYTAIDYIRAIVRTLNGDYSVQAFGLGGANTTYPISAFITDLVYLKGTRVKVDAKEIMAMGVRCQEVEGGPRYDADCVRLAMKQVWSSLE